MRKNIRIFDKIGLYITSLWLLFFLILVLKIDVPVCFKNCEFIGFRELLSRNVVPFLSLLLLLIGIVYFKAFDYRIKGTSPLQVKIINLKNKNYEHLTFLTTYIVPLICFDLSSVRYTIILGVLLVIIGAIYVKTDLFFANPTLALLGFHIYEVDVERTYNDKKEEIKNAIVVGKLVCLEGEDIKLMRLDKNIFYGSKVK